MMSVPMFDRFFACPDRKPSPRPTSSSREPTPQAMPNIVRNERSLCAHKLRNICRRISKKIILQGFPGPLLYTRRGARLFLEAGLALGSSILDTAEREVEAQC